MLIRDAILDDVSYGRSTKKPSEDGTHTAHSKRAVASDIVALVDVLYPGGKTAFLLAGHDRGARVAYRLALDHGDRPKGVCIMDIAPLTEQLERESPNVIGQPIIHDTASL